MIFIRYLLVIFFFRQAYIKKRKRYIYLFAGIILLLFSFIKTVCLQQIYGEENTNTYSDKKFFVSIDSVGDEKTFSHQIGKYKIICEPKAKINLYAKVAYIDYNDTMFGSFDYYANPVYDTVSPIDLSVFIGSMAENWKKYKVKHERRAMLVYGDIVSGEWENIHIIPATKNIRHGFDTIKTGDNILIKGFLVNWHGTDAYDYIKMKTALSFETVSQEKIAGRATWLCMQLYVTELTANGYTFK